MSTGSASGNAYLRRVHGEFVVITHPCHPLVGRSLPVLHYRPRGPTPTVVAEFPDGSAQVLPLSWTDRGAPSAPEATARGRLYGIALLEVVRLLEAWNVVDQA